MRVVGVALHDASRMISRWRLWFGVALGTGIAVTGMLPAASGVVATRAGILEPTAPSLLVSALASVGMLCIVWPLCVGGSVAEDRGTGLVSALTARSGSRTAWMTGKLLSLLAVSGIATLLIVFVSSVVAFMLAPLRWNHLGDMVSSGQPMATSTPGLYILAAITATWLALSSVSALSLVAGLFTRSPLSSQAVAVAVYAATLVTTSGPFSVGSRTEALALTAEWASPDTTVVYWCVFLVGVWLLAQAIMVVRGEA